MNKDVIYIEPEDDITDIITKIENSKEKIVALVPPKKAGVFRSVVNIKLISKAGKTAEKTIVLVTMDPSIVKLAAATRMPITKNLQTPPAIPEMDAEMESVSEEEIISEPDEMIEEEIDKTGEQEDAAPNEEELIEDEKPKEKKDKKSKKKQKSSAGKTGNPVLDWIKSHKKITIISGVGLVVLILVLIWMFAIAPAVTVNVGIRTETSNFSEMVTFTTNAAEENASEGKFYLEEKKMEVVSEVQFDATGQKNLGEKAHGELTISTIFAAPGAVSIDTGTIFTMDGLSFLADEGTSLAWSGDEDECENTTNRIVNGKIRCQKSGTVKVTASEPGTKYNIAPSGSNWKTVSGVDVKSTASMSGGTDNIVTVVEQADVEKAKNELKAANEEENKAKLMDSIEGDNSLVIDSSFTQDTSVAAATPAAGEEVKDGQKPVLKATTTDTVYVVDKSKVIEFITSKAKLEDDQKIYEIKDPYIENFVKGDTGYAGRLKTSYAVGPEVTENDILEMVRGKGIGDAQHDLKSINGITSVTIDKSYPWVSSVPGDSNKITINIEVKDQ